MSHLLKATEDGPASEPWSALTSYLTNVTGTFFAASFKFQRSRFGGLTQTTVHTSEKPDKTFYPFCKYML